MASTEQVSKILGMVTLCGGQEKADKFKETIKRILPTHIQNKERFITMFEEVVRLHANNPKVTDKKSILPCVYQAAKMGLYPDPAMGQIFFIPYKGVLTYQNGYKGLIAMVKNGGNVVDIRTGRVFQKEIESGNWNYYEDEKGQHFTHIPLAEEERGSEVWVYSCAETREGKVFIHLMESWHVDKIKKIALARTPNSPWANPIYEPEMRKKTAIRRHCKTLDVSPDLQIAIEHEESVERGEIPKYEIPEDLINQAIDETTQETIASDMPPEHMDFVNKP